ncbi:hypothetical protein [Actinomadura litoris]|uniref:hypothetical protein n=1 Tax=Actinomadura litoris TaxID=2678616 RepID=UPI001FA7288A|nr:hypothetical protein [Actinomadura litoris]
MAQSTIPTPRQRAAAREVMAIFDALPDAKKDAFADMVERIAAARRRAASEAPR